MNYFKFFIFFALVGCIKPTEPERNYCPRISLINNLDRYPFNHTQTNPEEIRILEINGKCQSDSVKIKLLTLINLSDSNKITQKDIPYFIAVVDNHQNVIDRRDFLLKRKSSEINDLQTHEQNYQLIPNFNWETMQILIGFKLNDLQMQLNTYNKAHFLKSFSQHNAELQAKKVKQILIDR